MTTYTITTNQNITDLATKTGGDTYNINGGSLTIDTDSRYGLNQSTLAALGNITISSVLGGSVFIDSRYVRIIPFNSGAGNVPVADTIISQGAVTSKLIGVWSAINVAPIASGSAMPVSGFIKVRQISQVPGFTSGALVGISASATGGDKAGWLEITADESKTLSIPKLGILDIKGDWFEVGTVGADNTVTYQLPTSGQSLTAGTGTWFSGVYIAKVDNPTQDSDYEFYPSLGTFSGVNIVYTDAFRGRVCWITSDGILYLGKDLAGNTNGYKPPTGRKIVIPNIILINCTVAARTVNALPKATLGTRYDFTITGGYVYIDKVMSSWYLSFSSCSALELSSIATSDQFSFGALVSESNIYRLGVGFTAIQSNAALTSSGSLPIITITDCVFVRYNNIIISLIDVKDIVFNNLRTIYATSNYYSLYMSRSSAVVNGWDQIGGYGFIEYCLDCIFNDIIYSGVLGATSTRGSRVLSISTASRNISIDGVYAYDDVSYPSTDIISLPVYYSVEIKITNIGSPTNVFNLGAVTPRILDLGGPWGDFITMSRVWVKNLGSPYYAINSVSSVSNFLCQNIYVTEGNGPPAYTIISKSTLYRGSRFSSFPSAAGLTLTAGTYWHDYFLSDTTGAIRLQMSGPSEDTESFITLTGGAKFTGTGYLYMPTIGMSCTYESKYSILGHTGFSATAPTFSSNYTAEYQIDTGSGYSIWKALTTANLTSENASIDYTLGFRLKVRLTTSTTNTTQTSDVVIQTITTAEAQSTLYPLGEVSITFPGVNAGSEIRLYSSTGTSLAGVESCIQDPTLSWVTDSTDNVRIVIVNTGYKIKEFSYLTVLGNQSIPVQQEVDPWYSNP